MKTRDFCVPGLLAMLLFAVGCPGSQDAADAGTQPDSGSGADFGCFKNPVTHVEILNACTNAQAIDKKPVLPLLRPDGTLPPLP